ncbi:distal tail protein [Vibrio phage D249]
MRLPDPFTDAAAAGFSAAVLKEVDPQLQDDMPDGTVLRTNSAAPYWTLNLSYPDLFDEEFALLLGTLAESKRLNENIEVLLPQYEKYRVSGDTALTSIASGAAGSEVVISNYSALTGRPYLNDLFQMTGGTKVYKITKVEIDTQANTMTLGLYPRLTQVTVGREKPIFNNILFSMVLSEGTLPMEDPSTDGMYRGVEITLRENVIHG